jgi:LysR family transcriptional regulator, transcription activator of glutamate synthase operon
MNTEWFYCFLEVARQKSLSKASEKLNLTQPALSKQIRNLEETLGVELFKRSTTGVSLTEEGTLLLERIQPVLSELRAIQKDLINLSQQSKVTIGTLPSLATYYLPKKLNELENGGIHINLKVLSTSSEIMELLQNGTVDIGIIHKPSTIPSSFWLKDLFDEPYFLIVSSNDPLAEREHITIKDLLDQSLIVYPEQCDVRVQVIDEFQKHGMQPRLSLELAFGESILGFVAAGVGVAILPEMLAKNLNHFPVRTVPIVDFDQPRTISVLSRKEVLGKKVHRSLSS